MRMLPRQALLAVALFGCALGVAQAATQDQWRTYGNPAAGFSIGLPSSWRTVPQSDAQLRALIRGLRSRGKFDLAQQYLEILKDPYQRGGRFAFHAFPWPADDYPVTTDVAVKATRVPQALRADGKALHGIAEGIAAELRRALRKDGGTVSTVQPGRVPAGVTFAFTGSTPLDRSYGGAKSAFGMVIVGKGHTVYMIQFRADSRAYAARTRTFARIASTISFR